MQQATPNEMTVGPHGAEARGLSLAEAHSILRRHLGRMGQGPSPRPQPIPPIRRRVFQAGEIVLRPHTHGSYWGLVVRGKVAVVAKPKGAAGPPAFLTPGCTFDSGEVQATSPGGTTLAAATRSEVWFITGPEARALAERPKAPERRAGGLSRLWLAAAALLLVAGVGLAGERWGLLAMGVGRWCAERGVDECARTAWQAAAALAPSDPWPWLALGDLSFDQGDLDAAERAFERAVAAAPESAEAINNLGSVYAARGEHERALAAFDRALELEPGAAEVHRNLGFSLQAVHRSSEALAHYQALVALGGIRADAMVNMAMAYYAAGQLPDAEASAWKALEIGSGRAPVYVVLGAVALERGQVEAALTWLRQAVALDAGYGPAYYYEGLAYAALGRVEDARAALELALATATDADLRERSQRRLEQLGETAERTP